MIIYEASTWQSVSTRDFGSQGLRFESPSRRNSFQTLNGASLHRALHVHPSIVLIWLKYCWKRHKALDHPCIHPWKYTSILGQIAHVNKVAVMFIYGKNLQESSSESWQMSLKLGKQHQAFKFYQIYSVGVSWVTQTTHIFFFGQIDEPTHVKRVLIT